MGSPSSGPAASYWVTALQSARVCPNGLGVDLELAKVPVDHQPDCQYWQSGSSFSLNSSSELGFQNFPQAFTNEAASLRDTADFCKSTFRACQDQMAVDADAASLSENQGASTCARCWPLGASELGYCICSDLVLAGILRPASGSD